MGQSMEYAKISRCLYCTALHLDFWAYAWNVNTGVYFDVLALMWKLVQREPIVAPVSQWSCGGGIAGVSPRLPTWISLPAALVGVPPMTQPGSMDSKTLFIDCWTRSELRTDGLLHGLIISYQFLEYQTDVRRCRYKPRSLLGLYIADTSAQAT